MSMAINGLTSNYTYSYMGKLMSAYDKDEDGKLSYSQQTAAKKVDALGLSALEKKPAEAESATGSDISEKLASLMESMSSNSKMAFSAMIQRSEQTSNMLSAFTAGLDSSFSSMTSILSQQSAAKMYAMQLNSASGSTLSSMAGQLLNSVV